MPPRSDEVVSSLQITPPPNRGPIQFGLAWMEAKHHTDGAEGLWRIQDSLYDFSEFLKKHPGGSEWLEVTKGTDITEAFEVHHLTTLPEEMLKNYFVRKTNAKRNSPFTFNEDGFYKTLKREVIKVLPTLPKQPVNTSAFLTDALMVLTFIFSIAANVYWSYWLAIIAGFFVGLTTIASHNYFHRKDNFRMYYFNLSTMQTRDWRISHVLSHHLHTNTIDDLEITMHEPLLQYMPIEKSPMLKYGYYAFFPLYWLTGLHMAYFKKIYDLVVKQNTKVLMWYDFVPYLIPLSMYLCSSQTILATLGMWNVIMLACSFHFHMVGLNAAHHHPDIFHDGDTPRSTTDYDWGMSQLDAIMDRKEISGSHFLVLTNFGDHALHHLFPTLDHGTLEHLYPTMKEVMKKFDVDLRMISQWDLAKGSFMQVSRTQPNSNPPDLHKKY